MTKFSDEKSLEVIQEASGKDPNVKNSSKFRRNISHFLLDFGVVKYTISLIIALSISGFLNELMSQFLITTNLTEYPLLKGFVVLLITFILSYIFVRYVFYKFIYTEDVAKEDLVKKAIQEKRKDEVKKDIEKDPHVKEEIKKNIDIGKVGQEIRRKNIEEKHNELKKKIDETKKRKEEPQKEHFFDITNYANSEPFDITKDYTQGRPNDEHFTTTEKYIDHEVEEENFTNYPW